MMRTKVPGQHFLLGGVVLLLLLGATAAAFVASPPTTTLVAATTTKTIASAALDRPSRLFTSTSGSNNNQQARGGHKNARLGRLLFPPTRSQTTTTTTSVPILFSGTSASWISSLLWDNRVMRVFWATLSSVLGTIGAELAALNRVQKMLFVAALGVGFLAGKVRPFWKRFQDVIEDVPKSYFGETAPVIRGRAVSVSDGDTFRFLHTPTPFHPVELDKEKKERASVVAMPIRICTIDTPETPKFGKPGQPFGLEAKEALRSLLEDTTVRLRLLQKDQYGRAVAQVFLRNPDHAAWMHRVPQRLLKWLGMQPYTYVDEQMLTRGLAEVYRGAGAVYGPQGLEVYEALEQEAADNKVGMWAQGKKRETAAEYKRRTK